MLDASNRQMVNFYYAMILQFFTSITPMKILTKQFVVFILISIWATLVPSSVYSQAQPTATQQVRQRTFEKVWQIVNEKFFDPKFGGVDWNAVHAAYAPQVGLVKSDAEFYTLLTKMVEELKTSHLEIITPTAIEQMKNAPVTVGLGLKDIGGQVVIHRILKGSSAAESELRPGFAIISIDGSPVSNTAEALAKLNGPANTRIQIEYINGEDKTLKTTVERRLLSAGIEKQDIGGGAAMYGIFESERLAGGIGYIRFTSFLSGMEKKITAAISSMHYAPGIIIDLRRNGGGDDSVALAMANMFFDKPTQLMITRTRKGDDFYYKSKPSKDIFRGTVVILQDEQSGSASEQFAAGMQEAGRAVVIGKTSEGSDMDADAAKLPTGAYFVFPYGQPRTPKGYIVEGHGVKPDIDVSLTRKDLLAGKDTQLEAAIEYIRSKK